MQHELPSPIGESRAFLESVEHISRVAPLDRPVLVVGERGTGKELAAARVHFLSQRWGAPFIKLNCAALAENLIEAELFGYEAGAYTGAVKRRIGRFEMAHQGTLFLDEIANASLAVQEKILRVIEYGEMERVGGNTTLEVDVRVVGATNVDLPAAAADGRFRDDLLDRLAFDVVTLPPLRYRHGDIPLLAGYFGRAMAQELGRESFPGFSATAMEQLEAHSWPGNVRELKNVVERATAHSAEGEKISALQLDPFDSPYRPQPLTANVNATLSGSVQGPSEQQAAPPESPGTRRSTEPFDFKQKVMNFERELLLGALAFNRYNQKATASYLSLSYHQLRNSLKKHDLIEAGRDAGDKVV
ncbi:phage shock protein operon transcriptional activator [Denitrobaculum tricleocarpae]|uniref:Phage shock protein operon transcriptional activator n=1 Tax=Denitrobaculum tricleocarpae TaxID=2591009 RepID=A0A545TMA7_9PROT|nr:phage shock protein operon transcriptional activator [Denitrobaculum tricleocarpae]TQV78370.1 phage shock protein operon transcriptional activator [Denitrobaculum tricleocarpae]